MNYINSESEIQKCRIIEHEIFNLKKFNKEFTVFPDKIFKKKFDKYYVLTINDWFHSKSDYCDLISFLKNVESFSFYASCPEFYEIHPIKIFIKDSFETYVTKHTYSDLENENKGIGIRKSGETFYYDDKKNWAILNDITNDLTIIGLQNQINERFLKSFKGKVRNINDLSNKYDEKTMKIICENYNNC